MSNWLKNIFKKKVVSLPYTIVKHDEAGNPIILPKPDAYINKMDSATSYGGAWGDSIKWFNFDNRRITGWKPRKPRKNELLLSKLASGRTGVFLILKVEYCGDPPDMFFADVKDLGYLPDDYAETEQKTVSKFNFV